MTCVLDVSQAFGYETGVLYSNQDFAVGKGILDLQGNPYTLSSPCLDTSSSYELLQLTPSEGVEVAGLLSVVLLAGFTFRAIAKALNAGDRSNENE